MSRIDNELTSYTCTSFKHFIYLRCSISLIINPMENTSDMDGVESENCSLSSSLPTKIANGARDDTNQSLKSVTTADYSNLEITKPDDYSSCEEETDESYSDTESEVREESLEKDGSHHSVPINTGTIKRFSGDCDTVTDVLTELDRTKNRKTYQLTKSLNGIGNKTDSVIEKIEVSLNQVSEGINIRLEESTSAEDYFCASNMSESGDPVVESFMSDLIDQAADYCEKSPTPSTHCESDAVAENESEVANLRNKKNRQYKQSNVNQKRGDINSSHFKKRLSNTSKASSDSSTSNNVIMTEAYDSDRDSGRDSQKSDKDTGTAESEGEKKPEPRTSEQNKSEWNKAQESMENSKKNLEILRQNAASEKNSKYFKRKISTDNKRLSDRIHPFHTHMLLYYGVYDTEQVLYAFQTLRNIIACDCRTFLYLSTTTSITNSPIKQLLVR